LVLQNIQEGELAVGVDVWMVDSRGEVNLRWFEWVIGGEKDFQEKNTSSVRRVIWSHDGGLPVVWILLIDWSGGAVGRRVLFKVDEFILNSYPQD